MNGKDLVRFGGALALTILVDIIHVAVSGREPYGYEVNVLLAMGFTILGAIRETRA